MNVLPRLPLTFLLLVSSFALTGAEGGGCGGSAGTRTLPDPPPPPPPPPPTACADMDQALCAANAQCRAVFEPVACPGLACAPDQPDCRVECDEGAFERCEDVATCEPVLCEIACSNGFAIGPDGCEICGCAPPPPNPCQDLDHRTCEATPGCTPQYGGSGGGSDGGAGDRAPCTCEPCPDGDDCDCACNGGTEPGNGFPAPPYSGCEPDDRPDDCEQLSEAQCIRSDVCDPIYTDHCAGGSGAQAPCHDDDQNCRRPAPPCAEDDTCEDPCAGPAEYDSCQPRIRPPHPGECGSDADCPHGYCEHFATCAGLDCPPPPPSICVNADCDDGSQVVCTFAPTCAPDEIAAVRNGCFECVDPRSCGPTEPPPPPSTCGAEPVFCDALPPESCPAGTVIGASNGCWACIEPITCQPVVCHDGQAPICRAMPPRCPEGLGLAYENGCYACIDPRSC